MEIHDLWSVYMILGSMDIHGLGFVYIWFQDQWKAMASRVSIYGPRINEIPGSLENHGGGCLRDAARFFGVESHRSSTLHLFIIRIHTLHKEWSEECIARLARTLSAWSSQMCNSASAPAVWAVCNSFRILGSLG